MAKILIIDDDAYLCSMVVDWLVGEGHQVESAHDGLLAADLLKLSGFDIIVLDWDLPGKSGIEILKEFRSRGGQTPVLMLTGKSTIMDKETGFTQGADDYITKPFAMQELAVRIRAMLRRPPEMLADILSNGDVKLDPNKHVVTKNGVVVHLQPKDFALLEFFMRYPNRIFSADVLLARVWASESEASPDALRTSVKRIRQALDNEDQSESASIIKTIPRVGYTLRSSS